MTKNPQTKIKPDRVPLSESQDHEPKRELPIHEGTWDEHVSYMDDTNYHSMAEFLGLNYEFRGDDHVAEKVSFLSDWAKEYTKSTDTLTHKMAIKDLIRSLGYQMQGKELVTKLYKWARLDTDRRRIEKQMEIL